MARNKGSDDLFRLIHSLSNVEVRYFKKFALRHTAGGAKHLELFNAIHDQKEFEEGSLLKKFKSYAVMKVYLFDMVLKSLLQHSESLEKNEELLLQIVYCRILQKRGLQQKAKQYIEKGLAIARRGDYFSIQEQFLQGLLNYRTLFSKPNEIKPRLDLFDDIEKVRAKQINIDRYKKEVVKANIINEGKLYNNNSPADLHLELDLPFLMDESAALTLTSQRLRATTLVRHYNRCGDYEKAYTTAKRYFQSEKRILDGNLPGAEPGYYMDALKSLLSCCHRFGKIKEMGTLLKNNWKGHHRNEMEKWRDFFEYALSMTAYYWLSGRHKEGQQFIEKNLPALQSDNHFQLFSFYIRHILLRKIQFEFSNGHCQQAGLSVNEFQALNVKKTYARFFKECELIRIVIQAELGNFGVMQTLIQNTIRKKKQLGITAFEIKFLNILTGMNQKDKSQSFKKLLELFDSSDERIPLWDSFIGDWIRSNCSGMSISNIIKARAKGG